MRNISPAAVGLHAPGRTPNAQMPVVQPSAVLEPAGGGSKVLYIVIGVAALAAVGAAAFFAFT